MSDCIGAYAGDALMASVEELRQSLFESPQERIDFIESRIASAEGDERIEMLTDLLGLYEQTNNPQRVAEISRELYDINPTYTTTKTLAEAMLSEGNYSGAIPYLNEASGLAENDEQRMEISLDLAEAYLRTGRHQQARSSARNVIELDRNAGVAYMKIAEIYSDAITECVDGGSLARRDRTVYWLILDYLEQAKQVDPSLARLVDGQVSVRSEEHTSELQSRGHLVCRLLLEKKKRS